MILALLLFNYVNSGGGNTMGLGGAHTIAHAYIPAQNISQSTMLAGNSCVAFRAYAYTILIFPVA